MEYVLCTEDLMLYDTMENIITQDMYDMILNKFIDTTNEIYINQLNNTRYLQSNMISNKLAFGILRFWQEYYYLYYLSLDIIKKNYSSNSTIIGIGESPMKIIFTQSLFYEDNFMKSQIEKSGNFPINLSFGYFPISGLSELSKKMYGNSHNLDYDLYYKDNSISSIEKEEIKSKIAKNIILTLNRNIYSADDYLEYFSSFKLDPKSIIESSQSKFIFLDRGERFNSCRTFIYLYYRMFLLQYPESSETHFANKQIFIQKFKVVTFDGNYDNENNIDINSIMELNKRFCIELFGTYDIYQHHIINLYNGSKILVKYIKSPQFFLSYKFIPNQVINYISLPEHYEYNTRCIITVKNVNNVLDEINKNIHKKINIKGNTREYSKCNLSNLIIYVILKKSSNKLSNMVINFDNIDAEKLSVLDIEFNFSNIEWTYLSAGKYLITDVTINLNNISNPDNYIIPFKSITQIESKQPDEYGKQTNPHESHNDESSSYKKKYLKYKQKYLKLKSSLK